MKSKKQERLIRRQSLVSGFLSGITAIGLLYPPKFDPVRYPHSHKDDLKAIGSDMWKAFEREKIAEKKTDPSKTA